MLSSTACGPPVSASTQLFHLLSTVFSASPNWCLKRVETRQDFKCIVKGVFSCFLVLENHCGIFFWRPFCHGQAQYYLLNPIPIMGNTTDDDVLVFAEFRTYCCFDVRAAVRNDRCVSVMLAYQWWKNSRLLHLNPDAIRELLRNDKSFSWHFLKSFFVV